MLTRTFFGLCVFLALVNWISVATASPQAAEEIQVTVRKDGDELEVNSDVLVRASLQEVWEVVTDFDHMAAFISNLRSSRVVSREGRVVTVEQKGLASASMLSFAFESLREMELEPFTRIRSRQIRGNMARFDGVTVLRQEGEMTRIESRVRAVPGTWVPPFIGRRFVESETREQFTELLNEIKRRQAAAGRQIPQ